MSAPGRPQLFTIPAHRAFADALVAGLIRRSGGDPLALARSIVLAAREAHPALRRGLRQVVVLEDWFWVYRLTYQAGPDDSEGDDEVYVAINRDADKQWSPPPGYSDVLGNCEGGVVPTLSSCIFTLQ